ncbi:sarcosine oxidase subunit gamma family protein [Azoarcus sp. DN11]|uniref:sarcosine oxidase subunit gamma n=1 Tax=Azoarcus sp. DN11 TaxID=356837 RepID=UPI000EB55B29|nr:sarcosine oxidase subunit gamma family protein [Azoarcus sp. DN11]AYH43956.1 sarcosine oxidase subunit gamma [Azoarcus sp. DN11]
MDLNPRGAVKSESPLAMARANVALASSPRDAGVVVREKPFLGHLVLRGNAQDESFRAGVERVLGLALPLALGPVARDESRGVSIQWMSPDEWLIVVPAGLEFEAEAALRRELSGHYAVMNVTGGQTVLELTGPKVRELLMKCTPYDVHPRAFPVGKGVSSVFAKSSAVIRRVDEERWELVIRRSFADYLYSWILDAAEEFGVFVAPAETAGSTERRIVREVAVEGH